MDFWTIDEYKKFADAMMDDPLYYYCFEVLYWTGMREGEMLALTYDDFDLEARTVSINKSFQVVCGEKLIGPPKTLRGIRKISISEHLCNEVRDYYNMCYDKNADRFFPVYKNDLYRHISAFFVPHNDESFARFMEIINDKGISTEEKYYLHISKMDGLTIRTLF